VPKKPGRRPYRSAEGWNEATDLLPLSLPLHFFRVFRPKNRMSSPQKPPKPFKQKEIELAGLATLKPLYLKQ
jgi:hypothetical protein